MNTEQIAEAPVLPPNPEQPEEDLEAIRVKLTDLDTRARRFIRQRPVAAVLAAAGAGYLLARLVRLVSRRGR